MLLFFFLEKHNNKSNKSFHPKDVGNEKVIKTCSGPFIDKLIITVLDFMMFGLSVFQKCLLYSNLFFSQILLLGLSLF